MDRNIKCILTTIVTVYTRYRLSYIVYHKFIDQPVTQKPVCIVSRNASTTNHNLTNMLCHHPTVILHPMRHAGLGRDLSVVQREAWWWLHSALRPSPAFISPPPELHHGNFRGDPVTACCKTDIEKSNWRVNAVALTHHIPHPSHYNNTKHNLAERGQFQPVAVAVTENKPPR